MLRDYLNGEYQDARYQTSTLQGSGGWARVLTVSGGQITVSVDEFDGSTYSFGPIPYRTWADDPPEPGARVWLLVDSAGEPGLALV